MIVDCLDYFLFFHINRELFSEVLDVLRPFDFEIPRGYWNVFMGNVLGGVRLLFILTKFNLFLFLYDL